jgi:hypothetical protein
LIRDNICFSSILFGINSNKNDKNCQIILVKYAFGMAVAEFEVLKNAADEAVKKLGIFSIFNL